MHILRNIFVSGKDRKLLRNKSDRHLSCIVEDHYKLCSLKKDIFEVKKQCFLKNMLIAGVF